MGTGRPDASMSLLNNLFEHAMDDGYAAAHDPANTRRPSRAPTGLLRMARRLSLAAILLVCALFATAGIRQLVAAEPQEAANHAALVGEAKKRSAKVDRLRRQLTVARAQYAVAQREALADDAAGAAELGRLDHLQRMTGFDAVSGKGVQVRVNDAPANAAAGMRSGGKITDRDLQALVNGLWAAGAQAISINGHRLTSLTAIREAGDAVLVDYRPLTRPYVVNALGDQNTIEAEFAAGPAGRYFKTLQTSFEVRFDMEERDDLRLPAASKVALQYAKPGTAP